MKKVRIVTTLLVALAAAVLVFAGCDLFASDYKKGLNLAKKASNIEATQMTYTRNSDGVIASNLLGTVKRDIYQRDGDVIYWAEQKVDYNTSQVKSQTEYWYTKSGSTYMKYTRSLSLIKDEEIQEDEYAKVLKKLNTGDLVDSIEFYADDEVYTFGFLTNDDVKEFRVIFNGRAVTARYGFKDNKLVYKGGMSGDITQYTYEAVDVPKVPV